MTFNVEVYCNAPSMPCKSACETETISVNPLPLMRGFIAWIMKHQDFYQYLWSPCHFVSAYTLHDSTDRLKADDESARITTAARCPWKEVGKANIIR